jgi:hypothetical protein
MEEKQFHFGPGVFGAGSNLFRQDGAVAALARAADDDHDVLLSFGHFGCGPFGVDGFETLN